MENEFIEELKRTGVVKTQGIHSAETYSEWNKLLDQAFSKKGSEERTYVKMQEMHDLGILDQLFNERMRATLLSIMPDPVLLTCHIYETAPSDKPHVFSDTFNGWHRDVNELPGLVVNDLNFVSMFINLSNVHEESGAFEVIPESFTCQLEDGMDSFKAIGETGSTFFWNRTLLHRASPNLSNSKRRILKISIQHNYLQNSHILGEDFQSLKDIYEAKNDRFMQFIFGSDHTTSPCATLPVEPESVPIKNFVPFSKNSKVSVSLFSLLMGGIKYMRRARKVFGP